MCGPSGGDCTLPRSVFLLVEQLYSDLPVLAPFSIPGYRRFRIALRHEANTLCITPGFLRGAVSGARKISYGALLPLDAHETIRPELREWKRQPSLPPKQVTGVWSFIG